MKKPYQPKTWVITDTHFNHEAMIQLAGRPEDADAQTIRNWKKLVDKRDLVIHLGDVIFSKASMLGYIMYDLPGTKVLCMGNHDKNKPEWYMNRGFALAAQRFLYKRVWFSHYPLSEKEMGSPLLPNIHGHFHNTHHRDWEFPVGDHNILLSLETVKYRPVLLDQILSGVHNG